METIQIRTRSTLVSLIQDYLQPPEGNPHWFEHDLFLLLLVCYLLDKWLKLQRHTFQWPKCIKLLILCTRSSICGKLLSRIFVKPPSHVWMCWESMRVCLYVFALDICYVNKPEVFFVGVSTAASVKIESRVYITFCGCSLNLNPSESASLTANTLSDFDSLTMDTLYSYFYDNT